MDSQDYKSAFEDVFITPQNHSIDHPAHKKEKDEFDKTIRQWEELIVDIELRRALKRNMTHNVVPGRLLENISHAWKLAGCSEDVFITRVKPFLEDYFKRNRSIVEINTLVEGIKLGTEFKVNLIYNLEGDWRIEAQ